MRREKVEPYAPLVFGNRKVAPREESSDEEEEDEDQEGTRNTRSQVRSLFISYRAGKNVLIT